MQAFTIQPNDAGQRADKFLLKACPQLPKSLLYKAFRKRDVKQNGRRIPPETVLQAGDVVQVYLPDDVLRGRERTVQTLPLPEIFYEDDCIVLLKKPADLPVHADGKGSADTLAGRFLYYLAQSGSYTPGAEQSFTPALCNRLDRNTEGFVIGAKTAAALREMNALIRDDRVTKQYLCLTVGTPPRPEDTVTAYTRRREGQKAEFSPVPREGFREMRTGYRVLAAADGLALVQVTLYTGRTHQIRLQMAALGCPVLGDGKYGDPAANRRHGAPWQQLAACSLAFAPPENSPLAYLREKRFSYRPDFCAGFGFGGVGMEI